MDRGILLLLAASGIWSTTPIFAKVAYAQGMSPMWLIELRLLIVFLLFLMLRGNRLGEVKSNLGNLALLGVFGLAANYFFYHLGLAYTTASAAQLLESLAPVFVLLLVYAMREEDIGRIKAAGVFITALGSMIILYSHYPFSHLVLGDAMELLAALTWGYFIVQGSRVMHSVTPLSSLTFLFGFSSLLFLPLSLSTPLNMSPNALLIAGTMGFLHTFLAYLLYFQGIKQTNPTSAGVIFALSPVMTMILEGRILGSTSAPIFYLGGAVAIAGVITVITQRKSG